MAIIEITISPTFRCGDETTKIALKKPAIIKRTLYTNDLEKVKREVKKFCKYVESLPGVRETLVIRFVGRKLPDFNDFVDTFLEGKALWNRASGTHHGGGH